MSMPSDEERGGEHAALAELAALLGGRARIDASIARLTGRSARPGDVGEFIAAQVFDIELAPTAVQAGHDGKFRSGVFAGRTVNVKLYGDAGGGIDIGAHPCDVYLVLSGPKTSRFAITHVYLFDTGQLLATLQARNVKIGIATSLRRADLDAARIYPDPAPTATYLLTAEQRNLLALFSGDSAEAGPRYGDVEAVTRELINIAVARFDVYGSVKLEHLDAMFHTIADRPVATSPELVRADIDDALRRFDGA
ncbi:hypothetical protein OHA72_05970 [Dactylosporangium sp. NBC_01737]|uniref:hypothetical protein n=1 Tax=Dactylosporangium sp. NBC_01737 TaxID=2975959 RepID=UPI002E11F39A|nr:hypothetical protein OHA72_05970 [Dactylosporangium sp. NBC_01737]